jgi:hypothetical protein
MNVGDPRKIDAARALVARMHDGPASVVDYEGNGFCWGFSLVGSAHPHTWQHGGVVDVGDSSACVAACATYPDICAERFVRRSLWESRSNGRYKDVVNGSSHANTADNDFYTPGGSVQAAVQRKGGWCGSAATGVLADNIGLDYVVIFEARKHVNNGPMLARRTDCACVVRLEVCACVYEDFHSLPARGPEEVQIPWDIPTEVDPVRALVCAFLPGVSTSTPYHIKPNGAYATNVVREFGVLTHDLIMA